MKWPESWAVPRGARALFGVLVAVAGALAAANPESAVLEAVNAALPRLAEAVPAALTACGALLAAFSQPPRLGGSGAR